MVKRQDEEETAGHSSEPADISSLSKGTLSLSENAAENSAVEAASEGDNSLPDTAAENEPTGKQQPQEETAGSAQNRAADDVAVVDNDPAATDEDLATADDEEEAGDQFEVPEILPLAGGREAADTADLETQSEGIQVRGLALANTGHAFVTHGTVPQLQRLCGLDGASLYHRALEVCRHG